MLKFASLRGEVGSARSVPVRQERTSVQSLQEGVLLSAGTESPLQTPLSGLMTIFAKIKT